MATEVSSFIREPNALEKAISLKEQANRAYKEQAYSNAARLYHECILNAKCYTQMTTTLLQEVAREILNMERDNAKSSITNENNFLLNSEEALMQAGSSASETTTRSPDRTDSLKKQLTRTRLDSTSHGEDMKKAANDLIAQCYNKLAACILNGPPRKNDDYLRAVYYCDKVLELESDNKEAIFRKACSFKKAERYEKAISIFETIRDIEEVTNLLEECREIMTQNRIKRDAEIRANFIKAHEERNRINAFPIRNGHALNGDVH